MAPPAYLVSLQALGGDSAASRTEQPVANNMTHVSHASAEAIGRRRLIPALNQTNSVVAFFTRCMGCRFAPLWAGH